MESESQRAVRWLRETRADPPGKARSDQRRRGIYSAALQQFEELLRASAQTGPASRPLPLFYALSQGGRALVAALGEEAEFYGHGLREHRQSAGASELLRRRVEPVPSRRDAFSAVVQATSAEGGFTQPAELGAIWAALPARPPIPEPQRQPEWAVALEAVERSKPYERELHLELHCSDGAPAPHEPGVGDRFARYPGFPTNAGVRMRYLEFPLPTLPDRYWGADVKWNRGLGDFDNVAPRLDFSERRFLVPTLPGENVSLSPLMLWWLLLFGLSVLARYHPGPWAAALDVDTSDLAVPLEGILERAVEVLPTLLFGPLSRQRATERVATRKQEEDGLLGRGTSPEEEG